MSELGSCPFCGKPFEVTVSNGRRLFKHDVVGCVLYANGKVAVYMEEWELESLNSRPLEDALRIALDAERQHARACEQAMLDAKAEAERLRVELVEADEDAARLAKKHFYYDDWGGVNECIHCSGYDDDGEKIHHTADCPITLHCARISKQEAKKKS